VGARHGRVVTNAVRSPLRPAMLWIHVVSMASARVIQRFGLLKINCVEALDEPAIRWPQKLAGLLALPILLPQPAQAHGPLQLRRFRLPAVGEVGKFIGPYRSR
jgi:hypothetical protein